MNPDRFVPSAAPPVGAGRVRGLRVIRRRMHRHGIALAMMSLACGSAAVAQTYPETLASRLGLPVAGNETRLPADLAALPGFQRRGNTLVGELKGRDGSVVRLVFDARTQALIGLRIMEATSAAGAPQDAACINRASAAPLPAAAPPAN